MSACTLVLEWFVTKGPIILVLLRSSTSQLLLTKDINVMLALGSSSHSTNLITMVHQPTTQNRLGLTVEIRAGNSLARF